MKQILVALVFAAFSTDNYAATNIFDNFNDGAIDTTKWQVLLPFGNSQVVENNGYVQSISRGVLGTKDNVDTNIQISGKFMFVAQDPKISLEVIYLVGIIGDKEQASRSLLDWADRT